MPRCARSAGMPHQTVGLRAHQSQQHPARQQHPSLRQSTPHKNSSSWAWRLRLPVAYYDRLGACHDEPGAFGLHSGRWGRASTCTPGRPAGEGRAEKRVCEEFSRLKSVADGRGTLVLYSPRISSHSRGVTTTERDHRHCQSRNLMLRSREQGRRTA